MTSALELFVLALELGVYGFALATKQSKPFPEPFGRVGGTKAQSVGCSNLQTSLLFWFIVFAFGPSLLCHRGFDAVIVGSDS